MSGYLQFIYPDLYTLLCPIRISFSHITVPSPHATKDVSCKQTQWHELADNGPKCTSVAAAASPPPVTLPLYDSSIAMLTLNCHANITNRCHSYSCTNDCTLYCIIRCMQWCTIALVCCFQVPKIIWINCSLSQGKHWKLIGSLSICCLYLFIAMIIYQCFTVNHVINSLDWQSSIETWSNTQQFMLMFQLNGLKIGVMWFLGELCHYTLGILGYLSV